MYGEKLFSSKTGQTASGAITITLFMMKITLDPFIYCMRLTIYRKALNAFSSREIDRLRMPAPRKQDAVTGKTVYGLTDTGTFKQEFIHNCPNNVYIKFNSFNDTWTFEFEHHLGIHKRKKNLLKRKGRHISKHRKY